MTHYELRNLISIMKSKLNERTTRIFAYSEDLCFEYDLINSQMGIVCSLSKLENGSYKHRFSIETNEFLIEKSNEKILFRANDLDMLFYSRDVFSLPFAKYIITEHQELKLTEEGIQIIDK